MPNDPQDAIVAQHYIKDRQGFEQTARQWTRMYASQPFVMDDESGMDKEAIQRLVDMGFDRMNVVKALIKCQHNESAAVEWLLSQ